VVVGVTNEPESLVREYVQKNDVEYTIAIEKSFKSASAFDIDGYPSAVLIDPKGTVAWSGHPASLKDSDIEKALAGARPPSAGLSGPLKPVQTSLDKEEYGKAYEALRGLLAGTSLKEDEHRKAAEDLASTIEAEAKELFETSTKQAEEKDYYSAVVGFERLAGEYKGVYKTDEAAAKAKELRADPAIATEIEAGKIVADGRQLESSKEYTKAYATYKRVTTKFKDTVAAEAAAKAADEIKSKGLLGYVKDCRGCKEYGVACGKHKPR
jgi:hypothetical protein